MTEPAGRSTGSSPTPSHTHLWGDDHGHSHMHGSADHTHGWDFSTVGTTGGPTVHETNDVVQLDTVGIDVGSSTSHVMFGHVRLERLAQSLSSRFVVTERITT